MLGRFLKRSGKKTHRKLGIAFSGNTVVAVCLAPADKPLHSLIHTFTGPLDKLGEWVETHKLNDTPTALLIENGSYMLQQFERPDVPEDELRNALRWKLKDLLDYPPTEAVVDFFNTPEARQKRGDMVQVVAASRKMLKPRLQSVQAAHLDVQRIDIPELALRNLFSRALTLEETTALLYFQENRGQLIICRDDQLFIARGLDYGTRRLATDEAQFGQWNDTDDRIALEVQRTMDYFDSHFGLAPVKRVVLFGDHPSLDRLGRHAANVLGVEAEVAGLPRLCQAELTAPMHELTPLAIGAALGLD